MAFCTLITRRKLQIGASGQLKRGSCLSCGGRVRWTVTAGPFIEAWRPKGMKGYETDNACPRCGPVLIVMTQNDARKVVQGYMRAADIECLGERAWLPEFENDIPF